ncbi:hypothetical protein [Caenibius sp. WL]|uniref:hypothetical protein n=1 Tax=Caenibius sp. WL TaxID=2872646 RepID=UPI001C99D0FF|nr:hypothetical protein [Caenibius sp. WL]QZP07597.1 hypothetical protein K5X80_13130 [Caenibius sp. WL]
MDARMVAARKTSAQRMLEIARDIGLRDGIDAIGVRSVAREADIGPSLVSYHYKGQDKLLAALHEQMMQDHYTDLSRHLAKAAALPRHIRTPGSFLTAMVNHLAHKMRPQTLLLLELRMHAALTEEQVDTAAAQQFWQDFGAAFDLPDTLVWPWAMMADAILWYAILDDDPLISQTWVVRVFQRFTAKLAGLPDQTTEDALFDEDRDEAEEKEAASQKRRPRSQEVTEAAIRLVSRGEKISHRTLAKEAGIPLASIAYSLGSKRDILADTYKTIYDLMIGDITAKGSWPVFSISADGKVAPIPALFGKLILHTAREDSNDFLSSRLRDTRGLSSLKALHRRGVQADRLDALIWSLCHNPYSPTIFGLPVTERADHFNVRLADLFQRLFNRHEGV